MYLSDQLIADAWSTLESVESEQHRIAALRNLSLHLPEAWFIQALNECRQSSVVDILTILAPHLSLTLMGRVVKIVTEIEDLYTWSSAVKAIIQYLPEQFHEKILGLPEQSHEETLKYTIYTISRSGFFEAILPHVSEVIVREISHFARTVNNESQRAMTFCLLAQYLPQDLVHEFINEAQRIQDKVLKAEVLAAFAPCVKGELRVKIVTEAFNLARAIGDRYERLSAQSKLKNHLSYPAIQEVFKEIEIVDSASKQAKLYGSIAPSLSEAELSQVLKFGTNLSNLEIRLQLWVDIVKYLTHQQRASLTKEALAISSHINSKLDRFNLLFQLAMCLPPLEQSDIIDEALNLAYQIVQVRDKFFLLVLLLPYVPSTKQQEITEKLLTSYHDIDVDYITTLFSSTLIKYLVDDRIYIIEDIAKKDHNFKQLTDLLSKIQTMCHKIFSSPRQAHSISDTLVDISQKPRPIFLRDLQYILPKILVTASDEAPQAAEDIYHAIQEVCVWWP